MSNRPAPSESPAPPPRLPADPGIALAQATADAQAAPSLRDRSGRRWADERGAGPAPQPEPWPQPEIRTIHTGMGRTFVEPGSVVRVVASATDANGQPVMVDLTSFGSQHYFRTGAFIAAPSRERLFANVVQQGERLLVSISFSRRFDPSDSTTVEMRSGETRQVTLPNGRVVTLTPTMRPETADEQAGQGLALRRADAEIDRASRETWRASRDRCRREAC